ncbi:MAG5150 family histidine triad lipoprotein [Mycoplasmopsis meleagridis]|uniref:MAG5150 family histidine triad lipoprotein n=1 Tax=Mycoplasmopsis meleagridis TaxID=29561 RepID=UPI00073D96C7|nr:hypothetical protein [Mycoplasmopsis meleagridis]KUH47313.1 hypothetical protein ASB56_02230 [Mycoplasmopsis meleagridis]
MKKFFLLSLPILIIPLGASCTNNSQVINEANKTLLNLIKNYQNRLNEDRDNFFFLEENNSNPKYQIADNSINKNNLNFLKNDFLLIFLSDENVYKQTIFGQKNNINIYDLYKKILNNNLINNYQDDLNKMNLNLGSLFDNSLNSLDSLGKDLVNQLYNNSINFQNFQDLNNPSVSLVLKNLDKVDKGQKQLKENWQRWLSTDYNALSNIFANKKSDVWTKNFHDEDEIYSEDNSSEHNHSHSLGNMIYENYLIFEKVKEHLKSWIQNWNNLKNKIMSTNNKNSNALIEDIDKLINKLNLLNNINSDKLEKIAFIYLNEINYLVNLMKNIAKEIDFSNEEIDFIFK